MGHRQAFAWIDDWIEMDLEDVRKYESDLQKQTNMLLNINGASTPANEATSSADPPKTPSVEGTPTSPKSPVKKGYFNWF